MKKVLIINMLCLLATGIFAQEPAKKSLPKSYEAAFTQQFGDSEIQVAYARPLARGRKIFGALIPFDSLWRTGANDCTTLKFKEEVIVGDKKIGIGKYSIFTIPSANEWTIILNSETTMHGTSGYDAQKDVHRFKVKSEKADRFYENFTIEINDINVKGEASLNLIWENTMVKIPLKTAFEVLADKPTSATVQTPIAKTDAMPKMDNHAGHDMSKMKNTEGTKMADNKPKVDNPAGHDMSKMKNTEGAKMADTKPKTDNQAGHDMSKMKNTEGSVASDLKAQFAPVLTAYYGVKDALVADNAQAAATNAQAMKAALSKMDTKNWTAKDRTVYEPLAKKLDADASQIGNNASKIDQQRTYFMSLSNNTSALTKALKINEETAYLQFCPMANNGKGAYWLSKENKVKNPYYGKSMLTCGSVKETLK